MGLLSNIVSDNRITVDDVPDLEEKLFFVGVARRRNLERFAVLMFFATLIATYGVIGDSTATVIGAMIVAPLMTPIMATAAALVMGRFDRTVQSLLVVAGGVVGAIALAWLVGSLYRTGIISVTTNSQIVARTAPRLVDLYAALASGAVGAFAMSRRDVADTLPGVAIAISLVPPLAVVGLCLSQGEWDAAGGAMLLFVTNFLSILLAGGGVLALLGLGRASTRQLDVDARRRAFIWIAVGVVLVAIPLAITSIQVGSDARAQYHARQASQEWVAGSEYQVAQVDPIVNGVRIVLAGHGALPSTEDLVEALEGQLGKRDVIELDIIPAERRELPLASAE